VFGTNFTETNSPYEWDWSIQFAFYILVAVAAVFLFYVAEAYMLGKFKKFHRRRV